MKETVSIVIPFEPLEDLRARLGQEVRWEGEVVGVVKSVTSDVSLEGHYASAEIVLNGSGAAQRFKQAMGSKPSSASFSPL